MDSPGDASEEGGLPVDPANLAESDHPAEARRQRRRSAIAALSGNLTGVYEPGYLDVLRQDWPE